MQTVLSLLAAAALVNANPVPQGVTAQISPPSTAPAGCQASRDGKFGIAVLAPGAGNGESSQQLADGQVQQIPDGQVQGVKQIADGQVQAPKVSQIADGQVQAPKASQIPDGQVQAPKASQIPDGQVQAPKAASAPAPAVSQIPDGQVQAPKAAAAPAVSQIPDGQVQAPKAASAPAPAVSQIPDGQVQAPKAASAPAPAVSQISDGQVQAPKVSQIPDGQVQAPPAKRQAGAGGPLTLTLDGGILKDQQGRIGYIADNRQFQFDGPPQTGAIYTAGWSVCGNGSLALGGSTTFYQCLSGDFYNLYDQSWAPQCSPVTINVAAL